MQNWVRQELKYLKLGDERLHKRLGRMVAAFVEKPAASVPEACGSWAATQAAYNFWASEQVTPQAIRESHHKATRGRLLELEAVLAIQDTTELDYTGHAVAEDLGYLAHSHRRGLLVHSTLVANLQGVPQGLVDQQVWLRDPAELGKTQQRRSKATQEKESQRWLDSLQATQAAIPEYVRVITVADREADIYDLFAQPRRAGSHLLIRCEHNRRVNQPERYLWQATRAARPSGQITLEVSRQADRPARQAILTVRFSSVEVRAPHQRKGPAIPMQIILAEEETPPLGENAIVWWLLTSLPVQSFGDACQCIQWYSYRWLIERYHFVLKSGCRIEDLQLEAVDRLQRALATYCLVAWRLLWLTYEARQNPDLPCDRVLEAHEWQALDCTIQRTTFPPATPPSLQQAVRWIAMLGGFLGRKHDGEPGVKTLWRGLRRLQDIADTWLLSRSTDLAP